MPPFFFSVGYLLAIVAFCLAWVYAIAVLRIRLFSEIDGSLIVTAALSSFCAAAMLGSAVFWKMVAAGHNTLAGRVGRAISAFSIVFWFLVITGGDLGAQIAPFTICLAWGGLFAMHFAIRPTEKGTTLAFATVATLLGSSAAILGATAFWGLSFFAGLATAAILMCIRTVQIWRASETSKAANLKEMMATVAIIAAALGLSSGILRMGHPLYSRAAVILPLSKWEGSITTKLRYYDVRIEYPKSALTAEQRSWFSGEHEHINEHFYTRFTPELCPTVVVVGSQERALQAELTHVSDISGWVGESLDKVSAAGQRRTIYLNQAEAAKLGEVGARIVIDRAHRNRIKRKR